MLLDTAVRMHKQDLEAVVGSVFSTMMGVDACPSDAPCPGSAGLLTAAVERLEERVSTSPEFPVNERDTNSALAIYQLRAGQQALQANLRVDDSDQYGTHTTGAVAYGYRLSSEWRATASYGTAFKAPTFNDLYYPEFSNPNLVPETSRNVEGGVYGNGVTKAKGGVEASS